MERQSLQQALKRQSRRALRNGALQPIPTEIDYIEQAGVRFIVRVLANLARKDSARADPTTTSETSAAASSPFLPPYDDDLFVADVSQTHVCLLNKFNVIDHHALIVTRTYEDQERLLTLRDFEALWSCMAGFDSLGFYNGGTTAGASQAHKHLQLVPLPLADRGPRLPIEPLIEAARPGRRVSTSPRLPFAHALAAVDVARDAGAEAAAAATLETYREMLRATDREAADGETQSGAYNLLVTREWMLLVPRSAECFESVSVNALGFAGAMLLRNRTQMAAVRALGPMTVLQALAGPNATVPC